jgi:hypothetical protein
VCTGTRDLVRDPHAFKEPDPSPGPNQQHWLKIQHKNIARFDMSNREGRCSLPVTQYFRILYESNWDFLRTSTGSDSIFVPVT